MNNIIKIRPTQGQPLAGGEEPPHDDGMDSRLTALETRFDTTLPTLATKADMADLRADFHKSQHDLVKWIVGTGVAGIILFLTVMTFVLNNAVPKQQAQAAPAPIVIQVPSQVQQPPSK